MKQEVKSKADGCGGVSVRNDRPVGVLGEVPTPMPQYIFIVDIREVTLFVIWNGMISRCVGLMM